MSKLIINLVLKIKKDDSRQSLSVACSVVGIICNLLLSLIKFILGILAGALSVTADAVNNLSDATVNIVSIVGTRLAGKPVDKEHPFGHGRIEYVSALIVSFSIFVMSFEIGKSSVLKMIKPEPVKYNAVYLAVMLTTVLVKLWMAYFDKKVFNLTDNLNIKAMMRDSLNDCGATLLTALALVLSGRFNLHIFDGLIGLIVAVFVFVSGISIVREILSPLLGEPPSKTLSKEIENIILENKNIIGVHDLIVHSYGHDIVLASAHAEVPDNLDLVSAHNAVDMAEKEVSERLNINICIHIDPVNNQSRELDTYKKAVSQVISDYNSSFTFHDFRLEERGDVKEVAFDLVVPFEYEPEMEGVTSDITALCKARFPDTTFVINTEHTFI